MAINIKNAIITNLRYSQTAASNPAISDEIDRQIATARSELIRVGVNADLAQSNHVLVVNAIITYALKEMGQEENYERYLNSWNYQIDNIRKSTITVEEEEEESNAE